MITGMDTYNKLKQRYSEIMDGFENQTNGSVKTELSGLLKEIQLAITEDEQKKTALFFPKASSKSKEVKELGFVEEQTAIQFLSTPQTKDTILERLKRCFDLGEFDSQVLYFKN